jgi:hypothetical protein
MTTALQPGHFWSYVAFCAFLLEVAGYTVFNGDYIGESDEVLGPYFKIKEL